MKGRGGGTRKWLGGRAEQGISAGQVRDILIVVISTAFITYLHYRPPHYSFVPSEIMIIYRRLYYLPIFYAAFRFGLRGGLLTSLTITALFTPHAVQSMGGLFKGAAVDNFIDIILFNVVALITGSLVEAKRRQTDRYHEVLALNREIEERESAIRGMKAYTDSILRSISSGVISVDRRGNVVTVNPEAIRLIGRSEEDLVAFPLERIFEEQPALVSSAQRVLASDQRRATMEIELASEDKTMSVAVRVTPHVSGDKTVGVVITLEDLTEVKNLTEQLMRADKLTGLGELVAGVAHEVRNPLGVIRASVQMIQQETGANADSAELTQVMLQEIDRLDALVNALLEFGRPSESRFRQLDPGQTLEEVVLLTRQYARQQGIDVHLATNNRLPVIRADEDRLKQIFVNLITNAIQAMPDGGDLRIETSVDGSFLKITFSDSGVGIPDDALSRIFDPFYTTRVGGSGLGLSIIHRIIDAHNGYVNVESTRGVGSRFTVGFPLLSSEDTSEVGLSA